jgi:hypothetical protein
MPLRGDTSAPPHFATLLKVRAGDYPIAGDNIQRTVRNGDSCQFNQADNMADQILREMRSINVRSKREGGQTFM